MVDVCVAERLSGMMFVQSDTKRVQRGQKVLPQTAGGIGMYDQLESCFQKVSDLFRKRRVPLYLLASHDS
jgi:hypothetical protein